MTIKHDKYDIRVANGPFARYYGFKLWHSVRYKDTGYRWRLDLYLGKYVHLFWREKDGV